MMTLDQHLQDLVKRSQITRHQAKEYAKGQAVVRVVGMGIRDWGFVKAGPLPDPGVARSSQSRIPIPDSQLRRSTHERHRLHLVPQADGASKASDLFITSGMPPSIKVQASITPITQTPLTPQQSRDLVLNVMTPAQREEFEKTHECNFAIGVAGVGRFRVSWLLPAQQVGMVLRRIETKIPRVDELNLPPVIKTLAMTKRGIIIFVGATGTGKSTSLAAMIGYRNQNSTGHIITIEDPIEFVHKHEGCIITQREVGYRHRQLGERAGEHPAPGAGRDHDR